MVVVVWREGGRGGGIVHVFEVALLIPIQIEREHVETGGGRGVTAGGREGGYPRGKQAPLQQESTTELPAWTHVIAPLLLGITSLSRARRQHRYTAMSCVRMTESKRDRAASDHHARVHAHNNLFY